MNFFKIKCISIKMSGEILCHLTTGEVVVKARDGYFMGHKKMVPLYDYKNSKLVGFFDPDEVNVEIEEE